ncbi:hypothetical protein FRC08_006657 [Ceratobasidium sp. 394]|nr:hypothetical protein FRC08_006657 [Ceratobasidium sp. 394]
MLVNMTGKENRWKETDLLQGRMTYWIKVVDKARGSNATWKWLGKISTCILALRELATQVNTSLAPRNSSCHTTLNLEADLDALVKSLVESKVHECDPVRHLEKDLCTKDVWASGLQGLEAHNSPIHKFNRDKFGARNHNFLASVPPANNDSNGDEGEGRGEGEEDNANDQDPQTQDIFGVVVDDSDDEDADPFDCD